MSAGGALGIAYWSGCSRLCNEFSDKTMRLLSGLLVPFLVFFSLAAVPVHTAVSQPFFLSVEGGSAGNWFGGDNRASGNGRHVGVGQVVTINDNVNITAFSFEIRGAFDYIENPDGTGHAVTLVLHVRDENGQSLRRMEIDLDASFAGGWVRLDGIDLNVLAGTRLIFTWHMLGALNPGTDYNASAAADNSDPYADGYRCGKHGASDADMDVWNADWICRDTDTWDYHFRVEGNIFTNVHAATAVGVPGTYVLEQNYPNPFNPATVIRFSLPESGNVELDVVDMLGGRVATLVSGFLPAGEHQHLFEATGLPSGTYLYRLRTQAGVQSGRMILLR